MIRNVHTMRPTQKRNAGFTLIELLIVIAIIAILAAILLPVLGRAQLRAEEMGSLNNLRQLGYAWLMYAHDNQDRICQVTGSQHIIDDPNSALVQPGGPYCSWIQGNMASINDCTNTAILQVGLIYPYINNWKVYASPGDNRSVNPALQGEMHVRSYSMNCWMNPDPGENWNVTESYNGTPRQQVVYTKLATIMTPSERWVLIEENPYSINDGFFVCDIAGLHSWLDVPASYYNHACALNFADGHAETKKWRDGNVINYHFVTNPNNTPQDPTTGDLSWLQQRTTSFVK